MAVDLRWAAAILGQATAEISAFLDDAGRHGIDRPTQWLRAEHLQKLRQVMSPAQLLLESHSAIPAELRAECDLYKARLLELQATLIAMNERLQQRATALDSRQEELAKLRLWLAAYRNSG